MADVVARLDEFDPDLLLPEHFFIIFYGIRRSGKTVMLRYLLSELQDRLENHKVYLFSSTAEISPEQYDFVPEKAKFPNIQEIEFDLGEIVGKQKAAIKEFHEKGEAEPEPILIILDDCVSEQTIRNCPSLNTLAVSGRHIHISVVILSQLVSGSGSVPPIIRTQCDTIFVVANPRSEVERKLIAEQYLTAEASYAGKQKGLAVLGAATSTQYRALVISTTDSSARRHVDYLYLYGPVPEHIELKLGTQEQWAESQGNPAIEKKKKQKTAKDAPTPTSLPNPFLFTPPLPTDAGGEYLRGLSENLGASRQRGRRRR
jgi:hypothetical protein